VTSISFADKTTFGQEMAQAFGMMGMFTSFMPQSEETKAIRPIFSLLQKLAPVFATIDFYRSEASISTFDGQTVRTINVTHYKEPTPPETEKGEGEQAEAASHAEGGLAKSRG
jgi:hypothetical protein